MLSLKSFSFGFSFILVVSGVMSVNSLIENNVVMFVFGDSLYDPGNSNYLNLSYTLKANHWPYGETFFKYPTGRYCDGRVLPDFIAMDLNFPIWKPYLEANGTQQSFKNGANFAAAGAPAIPQSDPGRISFKEQLNFFKSAISQLQKEVGEEETKKILMEAVYLSSIGGVDYDAFMEDYPNPTQTLKEEFVKMVIGNITEVIKEIYRMGGRKFAFQNVGPMGCLPIEKQMYGVQGDECVEELQEIAKLHNNALLNEAEVLEKQLQGLEYSMFDYYTSLYNIIQNPLKYGFKVADIACCSYEPNRTSVCGVEPYVLCSNPNEYVFFDEYHPSEHANLLLSQLMWNGESTVTVPRNFRQLVELQITADSSLENYVGNETDNLKM